MIFFERIAKIEADFKNDWVLEDNAKLYGVNQSPPPLAKHIIFSPMPDDVKEWLLGNYKRHFPEELLMLYSRLNGADLFWTTVCVGKSNFSVPIDCLSIYGIPLTNDRNHLEPFSISIEDCRRPYGTPDEWLKFGSYHSLEDKKTMVDLFIDTETKKVYGVKHQEVFEAERKDMLMVLRTWDSLDSCLCELFDELNTK